MKQKKKVALCRALHSERDRRARVLFIASPLFKRVDRDEILVEIKGETPTARYEELSRRADISYNLWLLLSRNVFVRVCFGNRIFRKENRALKSSEI